MEQAFPGRGWLDKINKTIAMITASPEYQRWVANKRKQQARRALQMGDERVFRRYVMSNKTARQRFCVRCEEPITSGGRAPLKMCQSCIRATIVETYRSGLTTSEVTEKLKLPCNSVIRYLRMKEAV